MSKTGGMSIIIIVLIILAAVIVLYLLASLLIKIKAFSSLKFHPDEIQAPELVKKKAFITSDGSQLKWYGEIKPITTTIILGVHDFALSGKTFDSLTSLLIKADPTIALVSFDQRNFGQNQVSEPKKRTTVATIKDIEQVLTYLKSNYPTQKIYLYGAGFGANIAMVFMRRHGFLVDGLILDSMINFQPNKNNAQVKQALFWGTLFSYTRLINVPYELADYNYPSEQAKNFDQSLETFSQITVKEYFQSKKIIHQSFKDAKLLTKPVLLLTGEADPFQIPIKTTQFFSNIIHSQKELVTFKNQKHDLMLQPSPELITEVVSWIQAN